MILTCIARHRHGLMKPPQSASTITCNPDTNTGALLAEPRQRRRVVQQSAVAAPTVAELEAWAAESDDGVGSSGLNQLRLGQNVQNTATGENTDQGETDEQTAEEDEDCEDYSGLAGSHVVQQSAVAAPTVAELEAWAAESDDEDESSGLNQLRLGQNVQNTATGENTDQGETDEQTAEEYEDCEDYGDEAERTLLFQGVRYVLLCRSHTILDEDGAVIGEWNGECIDFEDETAERNHFNHPDYNPQLQQPKRLPTSTAQLQVGACVSL
eukprot:SAG31_NODE_23_length_33717_cov_17.863585_21_plen_269_part_00